MRAEIAKLLTNHRDCLFPQHYCGTQLNESLHRLLNALTRMRTASATYMEAMLTYLIHLFNVKKFTKAWANPQKFGLTHDHLRKIAPLFAACLECNMPIPTRYEEALTIHSMWRSTNPMAKEFIGELRVKAAQGRKTSVKLTHTGMVIRKLDTFPHLLTQKAPKSEPVAPSYPLGTLNNLLKKSDTFCQFIGELRVKAAQGRKTSVKLTHTGMVIRKLDTFPHLLTQKAPKSEPVAPSYPPWTLNNLLKKSDTFCQFIGELRVKAAQGRKTSVRLTHTGMVIPKLDTFPHLLTQKAPQSEPVAPSYPPWTFGDLVGALWY